MLLKISRALRMPTLKTKRVTVQKSEERVRMKGRDCWQVSYPAVGNLKKIGELQYLSRLCANTSLRCQTFCSQFFHDDEHFGCDNHENVSHFYQIASIHFVISM